MPIDFDLKQPFTLDRLVRLVLGLAFLVGIFWLLRELSGALLPFAAAMLLAYLINPLVDRLQKLLKFRILAITVSFLLIIGFFAGVSALVTPTIIHQGEEAAQLVSRYAQEHHWEDVTMPSWLEYEVRNAIDQMDLQSLADPATIQQAGGVVWDQLKGILSSSFGALSGLLGSIIIILYLIFILQDYHAIFEGWKKYVPKKQASQIAMISGDVSKSMGTYFRAQALVAFCNALLFAFGFWLIGLPMGILLGLFVGLLNLIPYMQNIGIIPAAFLALMQSLETGQSFWVIFGLVLVVFAVVSVIEQAILTPRIMGDATGLNPAIILLALSIWGSLLGMLGLIIALPMTTVLIAYYQQFVLKNDAEVATTQPPSNTD
jgi:predicted PurR-regulated permease PerM